MFFVLLQTLKHIQYCASGDFRHTKIFVMEIIDCENIWKGQSLVKFIYIQNFNAKETDLHEDARMNGSTVLSEYLPKHYRLESALKRGGLSINVMQRLLNYSSSSTRKRLWLMNTTHTSTLLEYCSIFQDYAAETRLPHCTIPYLLTSINLHMLNIQYTKYL